MENETRAAEKLLSDFSTKLDHVEGLIKPLLTTLDAVRTMSSENKDDFDALSLARLHITLCYTLNSLFCMYLRTQGVDPVSHPIMEHIDRAQDAFLRLRKVEAGIDIAKDPKPKRDIKEHIARTNLAAEKLALVVFPEEYQLLRAIRNRVKHKKFQDIDDDNSCIGGNKAASNGDGKSIAKPLKDLDKDDSDVDEENSDKISVGEDAEGSKFNGSDEKGMELEEDTTQESVEELNGEDDAGNAVKRKRKANRIEHEDHVVTTAGSKNQNSVVSTENVLSGTGSDSKELETLENEQRKKDKKDSKNKKDKKEKIDLKDKDRRESKNKKEKKKKRREQNESKSEKQDGEKRKKKKRKRSDMEKASSNADGNNGGLVEKKSKKKARKKA